MSANAAMYSPYPRSDYDWTYTSSANELDLQDYNVEVFCAVSKNQNLQLFLTFEMFLY
jgi:hypothetical protein